MTGKKIAIHDSDSADYLGARSGRLLVELLANSPLRDVEIEHASVRGPVRDVDL